jgi:hypothetical protein
MFAILKYLISLSIVMALLGCASYTPIFYKNKKYQEVGPALANQDFKACKVEAESYLKQYKAKKAWKEAGRKALIGGVVGGAYLGSSNETFIGGVLIGSLVGAIFGGFSNMGEDKIKPDQIKNNYITRCLNQNGYEIIGWY